MIKERRAHMKKSKTGTENGFRVVRDGTWEPLCQQSKMKSRLFQYNKTKKKGFKGKKG